jgi:hypothetical protein
MRLKSVKYVVGRLRRRNERNCYCVVDAATLGIAQRSASQRIGLIIKELAHLSCKYIAVARRGLRGPKFSLWTQFESTMQRSVLLSEVPVAGLG